MGFYWDPESYIPNPGFLGFFFQKNRNRNIPEFFFFDFWDWDFFRVGSHHPKNPRLFPVEDLNFVQIYEREKNQRN